LFEGQRQGETENFEKKKEIIAKIEVLATEKVEAHSQWQGQIEKVEALRNEFFAAGKVPNEVNEQTWAAFKAAVRNFNSFKNSFYKDIKKDQQENLNKKMALVAKAKELQESEDFSAATPIMKQIQDEWKQIGHVPRKYSDKIWKEFKDACNHYFEKLKTQKAEFSDEESQAFESKKGYLDTLRGFELAGDHKTDLDAIKAHIETWKGFGRVPFAKRHIEGKFNKILDALFEKLSLSKKDTDMVRFSNRIDHLSGNDDIRKLDNEKIFLMRKIEEVQSEIFQLENNIQFFTNTKNAKKENSIVVEVRKNIEKHKEELAVLKEKLKQIRNLKTE
jgi:seryl-tRNA synthetase